MPEQRRTKAALASLALAGVSVLVSLVLAELVFQAYARLVVFPRWDRDMARPNFFLTRSENPILVYELKPGFATEHGGKGMRINRWGIRSDTDDRFAERRKLAILGDSVTNGVGHSQERTLDRLLEARLEAEGEGTVVVNFGVPGYATRELAEFLRVKNALYRVDHVLYLLNPNDFTRRDTITEGADNGLYRMFARPRFQAPWFVRKAIYRAVKMGGVPPRWYRWLFATNEAYVEADIRAMHQICREQGASFSVVLLPAVEAYGPDGFALQDLYDRLVSFLERQGIPATAPIGAFAEDPTRYLDATDHLYDVGNERMADVLAAFLSTPPRD